MDTAIITRNQWGQVYVRPDCVNSTQVWHKLFDVVIRIIVASTRLEGIFVKNKQYWGGWRHSYGFGCPPKPGTAFTGLRMPSGVTDTDLSVQLNYAQCFRGDELDDVSQHMYDVLTATTNRSCLERCRHMVARAHSDFNPPKLLSRQDVEEVDCLEHVLEPVWSVSFPQLTHLRLTNTTGFNDDLRGSNWLVNAYGDNMADVVYVPVKLKQMLTNDRGIHMMDVVRAFYLLRSHAFENTYEAFSGVNECKLEYVDAEASSAQSAVPSTPSISTPLPTTPKGPHGIVHVLLTPTRAPMDLPQPG